MRLLVQDIPFNPSFSDAAMARARKFLESLPERAGSTANFAIVNERGEASEYLSAACHRMVGSTTLQDRCLIATEAGWRRRTLSPLSRELAKTYTEYLLSWYAGRFILNRDVDDILDNGFVLSCDVPAPILQNLCIATRAYYEVNTATFEKFSELLSKGIQPDVAYICTFSLGASHPNAGFEGDGRLLDDAHAVSNGGGHRPHRLLPLDSLIRMAQGEVGTAHPSPLDGSEMHRTVSSYRNGSIVFDDISVMQERYLPTLYLKDVSWLVPDLFKREDFKAVLRDYRLGNASTGIYRPPNPFVRSAAALKPDQLSHKEFFEVAVPYVNQAVQNALATLTAPIESIAA